MTREPSLSRYRVSHMHSCGHADDCFLQRDVAEVEPCRECRATEFNRKQSEQASKPPTLFIRSGDAAGLAW